jgi:hypothetical protein
MLLSCILEVLGSNVGSNTVYRGWNFVVFLNPTRQMPQLRPHLFKLGLTDGPICERCLEEDESATHILCDCEAVAYLRFRRLGQFFMEPSDYYDAPIDKVLRLFDVGELSSNILSPCSTLQRKYLPYVTTICVFILLDPYVCDVCLKENPHKCAKRSLKRSRKTVVE